MTTNDLDRGAGSALPAGTVTLLLGDVEGSVRLWESDRSAMVGVATRLDELVSEAVAKHGGARPVEQGEGDSFVAAFARASDAVACAIAIQTATRDEPWPGEIVPHYRMALHTGEAQFRDEGNYAGTFINRCARLRDIGHGGQILVSRTTHDLAVDSLPDGTALVALGAHRLRDLARPEEVFQVSDPALEGEFPPLRSLDALPNNLPVQLTSFIGREAEMAQIRSLLAESRVVTLTGAGGAGKTRLAAQVAADVLDAYPDGVWWVDLAPLGDPSFVPGAVASVLCVSETPFQPLVETIVRSLHPKTILLVLDNCEHVVAACAELATALVRSCPSVAVVATSREPLGVEGEVAWRVPSLTMPGPKESSAIESLTQYEAVRLFIDRALRARPNFTVTNENAPAVAEVCHRLDGIPLAIELAAARVRLLTPAQIADGLSDRFRLLTGGSRTAMPRQQTLEASVDWSYDQLGENERRLLGRLSVFAGSFSLDAAEVVCSGDGIDQPEVLDLLSRLVDRSLVQVEDAHPVARYRLLETIRQYGRRKLAAADESDAVRDRHLAYFVDWAGPWDAMRRWRTDIMQTIDRLDVEIDNIRSALDWAEAARRTDDALRLGTSLVWLWWMRRGAEGKRRLEAILEMPGGDPLLRAAAKHAIAQASWTIGDPFTGIRVGEQAVAEAREAADDLLAARAAAVLGFNRVLSGDAGALEDLGKTLEFLPEDDGYYAIAAIAVGGAHFMGGDWPAARSHLEKLVAMMRGSHDLSVATLASLWLSIVSTYQGDFAVAERCIEESLALTDQDRANPTVGFAWTYRGLIYAWRDEPDAAIEAVERAIAISVESATPWVEWIARWNFSYVQYAKADYVGARATLEQVLPFLQAFNPGSTGVGSRAFFTEIVRAQGDVEAARARVRELPSFVRGSGNRPWLAGSSLVTAAIAITDGDLETADDLAHDSLPALVRADAKPLIVDALELIAAIAAGQESHREAGRLFGAAAALRERLGYRFRAASDLVDAALGSARETLGEAEWETAWAEGAAMSLEEAVAYAERGRGERKRPSAGWASLTPTELDVVRLVAEGLTNKQIGERLFIATSTVKVHVSHIFGKLGISTRSELASQATRRQL